MPAGVTVAVWQGREGTKLGTDEPMCLNLDAVKAALKIGAETERPSARTRRPAARTTTPATIRRKRRQPKRPMSCSRRTKPCFTRYQALGKGFGLVVADEGFWQDGITGTRLAIAGPRSRTQSLSGSLQRRQRSRKLDQRSAQADPAIAGRAKGHAGRLRYAPAADRRGAEAEHYDQDSSCSVARKLEWQRKVETGMSPEASDEEWQEAVKQFGFIGQIPARAAMWRALDDLIAGSDDASGRLILETSTTETGTVRWLRVIGHKDIVDKFAGLPLIHADATLPLDLVRNYLPNLQLACDLDIETPHMRVIQVTGTPVGKAALVPKPPGERKGKQRGAWTETGEEAEERVARKRQRLVNACRHLAQGRRGLVITYKDIEKDFEGIEGVEVAHFGAIEGIDRWRDVDVVVIIGRPLPRPNDIERMAAAITGQPVIAGKGGRTGPRNPARTPDQMPAPTPRRKPRWSGRPSPRRQSCRPSGAPAASIGPRTAPVEVYLILDDTVVPGQRVDPGVGAGGRRGHRYSASTAAAPGRRSAEQPPAAVRPRRGPRRPAQPVATRRAAAVECGVSMPIWTTGPGPPGRVEVGV